jgi:8-amino-7-oxononanoate synthase
MINRLMERWSAQLEELRVSGRYRELREPAGIDFVSNDYLGYGRDPWPSAPELPCSGLASRLLRGHHPIWDTVEGELKRFHDAEACLMMNSGFSANEGLLSTILQPDDWVASDEFNHASIIDGLRLSRAEKFVFRHNDLDELEDGLRSAHHSRRAGGQCFIVTESLFSMEGDRAPLAAMVGIAERYDAHLIVDEAHATGCLGRQGSGCVDALGLRQRVLATVHTGGKALGVTGGYVVGSRLLRELLVNCCRPFIFTTALPPVVGTWWLRAIERVQRNHAGREALGAKASYFRNCLREQGVQARGSDHIVPVVIGDDNKAVEVAQRLQGHGWDIRAIRPPTVPAGQSRLRISIHADHGEPVLAKLAMVLGRLLAESRS